ncbi:hypothetical protein [Thalassolituus sp. UBA2009]|uniref:hypothetical protein n=1 Tax=Thalassolituus sp. UBA2009 TaxID=1947658 RepID=UPI00257B0496|nr:hypothetical protein [Thalassolituus sp. UBA2009]
MTREKEPLPPPRSFRQRIVSAAASALFVLLLAGLLITLDVKIGITYLFISALLWVLILALGLPLLLLFFPALGYPLLLLLMLPEQIFNALRQRSRRQK